MTTPTPFDVQNNPLQKWIGKWGSNQPEDPEARRARADEAAGVVRRCVAESDVQRRPGLPDDCHVQGPAGNDLGF
jgi:hypothetical protein